MEQTHTVVDMNSSNSSFPLSKSMQLELNKLWVITNEAKNCSTIFRTPYIISQGQKNLFVPSTLSIGPFHREQNHLRALEEQKWRFLQHFLSRGNHISLDHCISVMRSLEKETRRCYSETFDNLPSDAFVKMMLLDGCFVLEYFMLDFQKSGEEQTCIVDQVGWNSIFIQRDLLLLENQIPFFIVKKLYEIGNLNQEVEEIIFVKNLACKFFSLGLTKDIDSKISDPPPGIPNLTDYKNSIIPDPPNEIIHHLVHLCYHYLVPKPDKPVVLSSKSCGPYQRLQNSPGDISSMVIPSATELKLKGVKFEPKINPKNMLDISFEYGVLKIPQLAIHDATKPIFANLTAFEHSKYGQKDKPITSFVAFLDNLVTTQNDVTILKECKIIENWLGSEKELAQFLNQVTENIVVEEDHYLAELYEEVNRYIESSWNKHRAKLIRDYFSSPWTAISLVAAFILLVLTLVQSFFAIYAYYVPPSS